MSDEFMAKLVQEREKRSAELMARWDAAPLPPTVSSLCLEQTLYTSIQLNPKRDLDYIRLLRYGAQQFDAHCVHCGQASTFRTLSDREPDDMGHFQAISSFNSPARVRMKRLILEDGQFALHVGCTRRPDHFYSYFFYYNERDAVLQKIGQMPSVEDVAGASIERYRSILGKDFSELRRATGLFAHGIGIGAFVYLRRIFENLVESARRLADPDDARKADFLAMKMTDRVKELSAHLPPAVVKYKDAYGILSKGLHELTEDDCKKYFPAVRAAIVAMLEQRYEAEEKAKAAANLDREMEAIVAATKGAKEK